MSNKSSSDLSYFLNIHSPDFSLSAPSGPVLASLSQMTEVTFSPSCPPISFQHLSFSRHSDLSKIWIWCHHVDTQALAIYHSKAWVMDQNKACEDMYCLVPLFWPLNKIGLTYFVTYLSLGSLRYHCLASESLMKQTALCALQCAIGAL